MDIEDPLTIPGPFNAKVVQKGIRLLMVSSTGEPFGYYELDAELIPQQHDLPEPLRKSTDLIAEKLRTLD